MGTLRKISQDHRLPAIAGWLGRHRYLRGPSSAHQGQSCHIQRERMGHPARPPPTRSGPPFVHDFITTDCQSSPALYFGSLKKNIEPCPTLDIAHMRPSWPSMIDRQIERPIPSPFRLVVKSGSKMWPRFCGSIPAPESSTETKMSDLASSDFIRSVRSGAESMASTAFLTRFKIT